MKAAVRIFDTNNMDWTRHERFPNIQVKVLEGRATHPAASVMLVQLKSGGLIDSHVHEVETETALVLAGKAQLTFGDEQALLAAGTGVTIPPGTLHSLRNMGDVTLELIAIHTPPTR